MLVLSQNCSRVEPVTESKPTCGFVQVPTPHQRQQLPVEWRKMAPNRSGEEPRDKVAGRGMKCSHEKEGGYQGAIMYTAYIPHGRATYVYKNISA